MEPELPHITCPGTCDIKPSITVNIRSDTAAPCIGEYANRILSSLVSNHICESCGRCEQFVRCNLCGKQILETLFGAIVHINTCYHGGRSISNGSSFVKCGHVDTKLLLNSGLTVKVPSYTGVNVPSDLISHQQIVFIVGSEGLFHKLPQSICLRMNYDLMNIGDLDKIVFVEYAGRIPSIIMINLEGGIYSMFLDRLIEQNVPCIICGMYFDSFPTVEILAGHVNVCSSTRK